MHDALRGLVKNVILAFTVAITGCASNGKAVRAGDPAPHWTLEDTEGVERSMTDYRGNVVLMDFWATWCAPCRRAGPHMQALQERYGDEGLVVLGFQHQDDADPRPYLREHGYTYTVFPAADDVARAYGGGLPSFVVVDRDGIVALHKAAFFEGDQKMLARAIEQELTR